MITKVELVWHDVKEELPEFDKFDMSERLLISIYDMDAPDEDADKWEKDFYTPFFVSHGYLQKLTTGCAVWLYNHDDSIVEELHCVVTHWAEKPKPVVVEGTETG